MSYAAGQRVEYKGMTMPAKVISGPHKSPGADRYLIQKSDGNVSLVKFGELTALPDRRESLALAMYRRETDRHAATWEKMPPAVQARFLGMADAAIASLGTHLAPEDAGDDFWVLMSAKQVGALHCVIATAVSGPPNGLRGEMETLHNRLAPLVRAHEPVAKAHTLARQTMTRRPGGSLGVHFTERA